MDLHWYLYRNYEFVICRYFYYFAFLNNSCLGTDNFCYDYVIICLFSPEAQNWKFFTEDQKESKYTANMSDTWD